MIFGASQLVGSSLNLNNPVPGLPDVDVLLSYSYIIEIPASCPDVPAEPELPALPAAPALLLLQSQPQGNGPAAKSGKKRGS